MIDWLLLSLLTAAAIAIHSVTGLGFAQFVAPALLLTQPAAQTVTTLLLIGVLINGVIVAEGHPAGFEARRLLPLLPGSLLGLPAGVAVVVLADEAVIQVLVGAVVAFAATVQFVGPRRRAAAADRTVAVPVAIGALSGALTTSSGIGAAPVVLWLERRTSAKEHVRHGIAAFSIWLCVLGAGGLIVGGGGDAADGVVDALVLTPAVLVGHTGGRRLFERIGVASYRRVVFALVLLGAATSVVSGLT